MGSGFCLSAPLVSKTTTTKSHKVWPILLKLCYLGRSNGREWQEKLIFVPGFSHYKLESHRKQQHNSSKIKSTYQVYSQVFYFSFTLQHPGNEKITYFLVYPTPSNKICSFSLGRQNEERKYVFVCFVFFCSGTNYSFNPLTAEWLATLSCSATKDWTIYGSRSLKRSKNSLQGYKIED